jgi:hypothetical protein
MAKEIEIEGLRHAIREIRTFDKTLIFRLRNRLRTATNDDRQKVKRVIQETTPLLQSARNIGMFHNGRTAWNEAAVDIDSLTGRAGAIVAIKATGTGKKFGYDYAELAGIRPPRSGGVSREFTREGSTSATRTRQNGQGEAFSRMLDNHLPANHKPNVGGRYAFQGLVRRMPYISKKVLKIIMDFADETSYKIATKEN